MKANYDHLTTQRTQFYGNLWYEKQSLPKIPFELFDIPSRMSDASLMTRSSRFMSKAMNQVRSGLKKREPKGVRTVEF